MIQSIWPSPEKLILQQQDCFTDAFTKCHHQSSDLSSRGVWRGRGWMRWINEFWEVHCEAWLRGGGGWQVIPAPLMLVVHRAQQVCMSCLPPWLDLGHGQGWGKRQSPSDSLWVESRCNQSYGQLCRHQGNGLGALGVLCLSDLPLRFRKRNFSESAVR